MASAVRGRGEPHGLAPQSAHDRIEAWNSFFKSSVVIRSFREDLDRWL